MEESPARFGLAAGEAAEKPDGHASRLLKYRVVDV
jgi:hypothetical protein